MSQRRIVCGSRAPRVPELAPMPPGWRRTWLNLCAARSDSCSLPERLSKEAVPGPADATVASHQIALSVSRRRDQDLAWALRRT